MSPLKQEGESENRKKDCSMKSNSMGEGPEF